MWKSWQAGVRWSVIVVRCGVGFSAMIAFSPAAC
jgi:hypothetical protein